MISSPYRYSDTYITDKILKYVVSPMALVDLLAILPFYLPLFIKFDFRIFRFLRLFRLLRILKVSRYTKALEMIKNVFIKKKAELILSSALLIIMVFFCGSLIYFSENSAQPENFPNIIESVKWTISTMVFLGYDNVAPITRIGKVLGMLIVVMGLGWLTLPISVLSSGFIEDVHDSKKTCPYCGKEI